MSPRRENNPIEAKLHSGVTDTRERANGLLIRFPHVKNHISRRAGGDLIFPSPKLAVCRTSGGGDQMCCRYYCIRRPSLPSGNGLQTAVGRRRRTRAERTARPGRCAAMSDGISRPKLARILSYLHRYRFFPLMVEKSPTMTMSGFSLNVPREVLKHLPVLNCGPRQQCAVGFSSSEIGWNRLDIGKESTVDGCGRYGHHALVANWCKPPYRGHVSCDVTGRDERGCKSRKRTQAPHNSRYSGAHSAEPPAASLSSECFSFPPQLSHI